MILIGSIIIAIYLIIIGVLIYGYSRILDYTIETRKPKTKFSIIVPFRNEATALPDLLSSIEKLEYPMSLVEVIFIDDSSEDCSVEQIENHILNRNNSLGNSDKAIPLILIKNIRRSASPKKDAITTAIDVAKNNWIITTDADCILAPKWLIAFDNYIQNNQPKMLVGPVQYYNKTGLVNQYQHLDNISLQTVTIGGFGINNPLLCNGANLAYQKELFIAVDGYSSNDHIASGDDIFLLEKIKKRDPKGIHFIKNKDAIVHTKPQKNWKEVINQRIRWASKTSNQESLFIKILSVVVLITNLFVLLGGGFCLIEGSFLPYYISFLIIKIGIDYLFLAITGSFISIKIFNPYFLLHLFIYSIITTLVFFSILRGAYSWKGRSFKK